jgi:AmiR/NasT family two-component response regulator
MQAAPLLKKILPHTPIIMFTLFPSEELLEMAIAAGIAAECLKRT